MIQDIAAAMNTAVITPFVFMILLPVILFTDDYSLYYAHHAGFKDLVNGCQS